jgi:hypothetical protein
MNDDRDPFEQLSDNESQLEQKNTHEQEWLDQEADDRAVLDRVMRGETTEWDYAYLAARLNYRG